MTLESIVERAIERQIRKGKSRLEAIQFLIQKQEEEWREDEQRIQHIKDQAQCKLTKRDEELIDSISRNIARYAQWLACLRQCERQHAPLV